MTSLRGGVVVLDDALNIQIWNSQSQELWGLRPEEVTGKSLQSLDIGLPMTRLLQPVQDCLSGKAAHQEMTLDARNRRGRTITCKVTITPLLGTEAGVRGVILLMEQLASPL